jgi:hypothetical protein
MNIVKIYKGEEDIPTFIIKSTEVIDSNKYVNWLGECKEEIYLDEELIDTIYHTI